MTANNVVMNRPAEAPVASVAASTSASNGAACMTAAFSWALPLLEPNSPVWVWLLAALCGFIWAFAGLRTQSEDFEDEAALYVRYGSMLAVPLKLHPSSFYLRWLAVACTFVLGVLSILQDSASAMMVTALFISAGAALSIWAARTVAFRAVHVNEGSAVSGFRFQRAAHIRAAKQGALLAAKQASVITTMLLCVIALLWLALPVHATWRGRVWDIVACGLFIYSATESYRAGGNIIQLDFRGKNVALHKYLPTGRRRKVFRWALLAAYIAIALTVVTSLVAYFNNSPSAENDALVLAFEAVALAAIVNARVTAARAERAEQHYATPPLVPTTAPSAKA